MREHLPLIALVWGSAIVMYFLINGGSFLAFLFGIAMVLAGGHEITKTKRRQNSG